MKKLLRGALTAGLLFSMSMPVYAEDNTSPGLGGTVVGEPTVDGAKPDGITIDLENSFNSIQDSTVANLFVEANMSTSPVSTFIEKYQNTINEASVKGLKTDASGKQVIEVANSNKVVNLDSIVFLADFQDIVVRDDAGNVVTDTSSLRNVRITWVDQTLVNNGSAIFVMHYSVNRNVLELLEPESVDYNAKTITCVFPDLSPVAIVYVPAGEVSNAITTRPAVDTQADGVIETVKNNTWFWFGGAAVVVAAVAGTVVLKKRNQE